MLFLLFSLSLTQSSFFLAFWSVVFTRESVISLCYGMNSVNTRVIITVGIRLQIIC